jgi:hypothetical protein
MRLKLDSGASQKERAREFNFKQIVGESPAMKKMLALAAKVAEARSHQSYFKVNREQAKTSSPKRSIMARNERTDLSSRLIALPFLRRSSSRSCSVMKRAHSLTPRRARKAYSSRLKAERFCSMRLVNLNHRG